MFMDHIPLVFVFRSSVLDQRTCTAMDTVGYQGIQPERHRSRSLRHGRQAAMQAYTRRVHEARTSLQWRHFDGPSVRLAKK